MSFYGCRKINSDTEYQIDENTSKECDEKTDDTAGIQNDGIQNI